MPHKDILINELSKLSKELLIELYLQNNMGLFAKSLDFVKREILSVKLDLNLRQQRTLIDEIDNHGVYTGKNMDEYLKYIEEELVLSEKLKKLENEYEKLQTEYEQTK